MNEIEKTLSGLQDQRDYWKMRYDMNGDENSLEYIAINDAAIKMLKETQEIDSLIQEFDTDCTAKKIVESCIEYVKGQDNELAGFRILTNADKKDYEDWKRSRDKGCEYCAEDKCRLCTTYGDYFSNGGSDKCSAAGNDNPCYYYKRINYCPVCGRKLVSENEVDTSLGLDI